MKPFSTQCEMFKPIKPKEAKMEEKLLTFLEVCEAVMNSKTIQIRNREPTYGDGNWHDWRYKECPDSDIVNLFQWDYRLKPESEWIPWTLKTAPECGEVLLCSDHEVLIIERCATGLGFQKSFHDYKWLLEQGTWTYNGLRCGMKVGG